MAKFLLSEFNLPIIKYTNLLNVNEYPQQFVATVLYKETEILFPINEDFIVAFDEDKKTLTLDLPEGLLAIYLEK